jgi:bacterioferritin
MSFLLSEEDRKKIIAAMNVDLGLEMGAIIQYMHHHFVAEGMESPAIIDLFESIAKDEMKHMQKFGERVNYLGGDPTIKVAPVKTGGDLKKMIQDDLDGENFAIKTYKEHINLCAKMGDTTTRLMLEEIVSDEEGHADTWETTLGIKK